MKKSKKEIISLTAKQVLLNIFDICSPFFLANKQYRITTNKFLTENEIQKTDLKERIYYLKKMGYIETFVENKEEYIEITEKGRHKASKHKFLNPKIEKPTKWDGKWRIVIFNIPEKHKSNRNFFRQKITEDRKSTR